jgi:hypothetical protein
VIEYIGAFDYVYAPLAYRAFLGGTRLLGSLIAARERLRRKRAP